MMSLVKESEETTIIKKMYIHIQRILNISIKYRKYFKGKSKRTTKNLWK